MLLNMDLNELTSRKTDKSLLRAYRKCGSNGGQMHFSGQLDIINRNLTESADAITCHVYKHKNMIASRYDIYRSCGDITSHAVMQTELRDETWKHNNIALAVIELFLVTLSFEVDISDIS